MIVEVRQGSVTDADVDVLVNASNTIGMLGSGVSAAIREACGPNFQDAVTAEFAASTLSGEPVVDPGTVIMTHAGKHRHAFYVAHAAVMDYAKGAKAIDPDADRIRRCCDGIWDAIELLHASTVPWSVGMVALGCGTGRFDLVDSTRIACETLKRHITEGDSQIGRVVFHGFTAAEFNTISKVVREHFPDERPDAVSVAYHSDTNRIAFRRHKRGAA